MSHTDRGDLRPAVADLREATDLAVAHGMRVAKPYNIGFLAHALLEQGEADEAARVVDRGDFPEQPPLDQVHLVWFRLHRARLRIETGNPEGGVKGLLEVGETLRLVPFDYWPGTTKRGRSPKKSSPSRDVGATRMPSAPRCACSVSSRAREAGLALLREAVEVLAGSEARLKYARALVDLGAAHRRANRRIEARGPLREGVDLAGRIGAFGLASKANAAIAATGARPRKVVQTGLDALTASERRVAQLAAEGMSNEEIAQTLFVTIKAVEVHLNLAYRKLDISSRAQLDGPSCLPHPALTLGPHSRSPAPLWGPRKD